MFASESVPDPARSADKTRPHPLTSEASTGRGACLTQTVCQMIATALLAGAAGAADLPPPGSAPATPASAKKLRVAFGDNSCMPTQLLQAVDLVCTAADLGLGRNNPEIKITKFTDTSKMTAEALASRKRSGFNWICYDNENGKTWPTPKNELADPTRYTILAAELTHAAGLKFIAEPNFELIAGRGTRGAGGKLELTDKQVPAVRMQEVAPHLDAISLQLQRAQADVEQYRTLTRQYAGEVRSVNPKAIIFVQVTSLEKSGKVSTPAELMPAVRSVAEFVDGIWIHNQKDQPDFPAEFMALMAREGFR